MSALRLFKRVRDKFQKKLMKKSAKKWDKENNIDFYNIEPLEERMLLSATPLAEALKESVTDNDSSQDFQAHYVEETNQHNVIDNNTIIDFAQYTNNNSFSQTLIVDDYILKGSGTADIDIFNENVVSPGYSPGIENVTNFSQASDATLIMEIESAGGVAGTDFDQLNASETMTLDGTLQIDLLSDFIPTLDSEYTILTANNIVGKFTDITGLTGFYTDYYFDIEQTSTSLKLITKEIIENDDVNFLLNSTSEYNDFGKLLNADYFATPPSTLEINNVNMNLGDFGVNGSLAFEKTLNGMNIIGSNITVELNADDTKIGVQNASIGMIIDNQKIAMESSGDILFDIEGFDSLDVDSIYTKFNQTATDYSGINITIGTQNYTFNDLEASIKTVAVTGLEANLLDTVVLAGDFSFQSNNDKLVAFGLNAEASLS